MSDDDVEYIGTNNVFRFVIPDHPFPPNTRPLHAVVLHIERCNDKPAYGMWFRKSEFNEVNIGRRPGGVTAEKRFEYTMSGRAMFRCPVVSRRHARIIMSDTQAYIVDLDSHHGTHILKPGETVSTMLKPRMPTLLSSNDVVTLGKTVGRGDHVVDPIVFRIGLVYSRQDGHTSPVANKPDPLADDMSVIKAPEPVKHVSKPSSGHYGVHVPSSLVSDESSLYSSSDSDIEELEGPPPSSNPASVSKVTEMPSSLTAFISPKDPSTSQPFVIDVDSRSHSPLHRPHSPSPVYDPYSPPRSPSPFYDLYSPPRFSPQLDTSIYPPWRSLGVPLLERVSLPLPTLLDLFGNNIETGSRSRSTSPMDLASSSPSPPPNKENEHWSASRSPSPFASNADPERNASDSVVDSTAAQATDTAPKLTEVNSVETNAPISRHSSPPPAHGDSEQENVDPEPAKVTANMLSTLEEKLTSEIAAMQSTITSMKGEVSNLHMHRRKYKARFNANVLTVAEKLTSLDERITDTNAMCSSVSEQLDGRSDLRAAIESMQARISALAVDRATSGRAEASPDCNDVAVTIDELQAMMAEIKSLRQRAASEIAADLQAVKAACKRALADITSQLETPLNPSLKRKRSDDEGEDENNVDVAAVCNASNGQDAVRQLTLRATPVAARASRPCAKRMRKMVSTVLHTATAMTLGAVATWSALAFS